jgi:hypothetical protein
LELRGNGAGPDGTSLGTRGRSREEEEEEEEEGEREDGRAAFVTLESSRGNARGTKCDRILDHVARVVIFNERTSNK